MFQYLEKIDPEKRQMRFYALTLDETLFGEWCLTREWGRIGSKGGQRMRHYGSSRAEVQDQMEAVSSLKQRRGYVCLQSHDS